MVDWKFDRAVEIDRVVFSLHRRGLVGEKRFESKRPIFGTVLPGSAISLKNTVFVWPSLRARVKPVREEAESVPDPFHR